MGRTQGGRETHVRTVLLVLVALACAFIPRASGAVTLQVSVAADVGTVDPGDSVEFTISLDNLGPMNAARVWANLTIPSATVVDDTAWQLPPYTGSWVSGNRRHYNFTSLPVTKSEFKVRVTVRAGPPDGSTLLATLAVNYTDEAAVKQPEVVDTATMTMSIPVIQISKSPSTNPVDPGAILTFAVSVRNSGSAPAKFVWVNDTLPGALTFVRVRNIPPSRCTDEDCRLTDLASGTTATFEIDVQLSPTAPRGSSYVNWLFANFTDGDGTLIGEVSAFAGVDVRIIQALRVDKVADQGLAYQGALASFTIWYNNTAAGPLGATWLNDTLPSGMAHDRSTPPATVSGNAVRWQFPTVAVGANSVRLVVRIGSGPSNGTVLVNTVTGDYFDGSGNRGQQVVAIASVTVSASLPRFDEFAKVVDRDRAPPGAKARYAVYYNNTGSEAAATVVVQDTIPQGTILANPSVAPTNVTGRRHEWRFTDVAPGPHALTYELVLQDVAAGATLVNFAFLNFTDKSGGAAFSAPPRSAVLQVAVPPSGVASGSALPLLAGVVLVAAIALVAYRALFAGRKTVVDEVFLLHRDGLLIKHYTRRVRPDFDSDILSGMLIAVQNFVNESFIGSEGLQKEGQLDELRFGEFRLVIERGKWVVVAAVLSRDPTDRIKTEVKAAIRDVEDELGSILDGWTGEMKGVEGADKHMHDLIVGKYARRARGKG